MSTHPLEVEIDDGIPQIGNTVETLGLMRKCCFDDERPIYITGTCTSRVGMYGNEVMIERDITGA